ncbi:MAG: UTP--glucose-1-phosphate uridylyltransferase GalU [Patescibacteria group bacterium]
MKKVRKAIIPVAGFGTRFLPITKAIPKCMLPIDGKPIIQYLVEEAVEAGIEEIIFVTTYNKRSVEDYFDRTFELEYLLESKSKSKELEMMRNIAEMAKFSFVRQPYPMGDGFAILQAESFVNDEPFAIIFEDEILIDKNGKGVLKDLVSSFEQTGITTTSLYEVPKSEVDKYGIATIKELDNNLVQIFKFVEKPKIEEAESNFAQCGRYICTPDVMKFLRRIYLRDIGTEVVNMKTAYDEMGKGNEIRTSNAIAEMIKKNIPVYGFLFSGDRYDTGDKLGYIKAVINFGLKSNDGDKILDFINYTIKNKKPS